MLLRRRSVELRCLRAARHSALVPSTFTRAERAPASGCVAQDVSAGRKVNHRISALQRAGDRDFIRQLGNQSSIATGPLSSDDSDDAVPATFERGAEVFPTNPSAPVTAIVLPVPTIDIDQIPEPNRFDV